MRLYDPKTKKVYASLDAAVNGLCEDRRNTCDPDSNICTGCPLDAVEGSSKFRCSIEYIGKHEDEVLKLLDLRIISSESYPEWDILADMLEEAESRKASYDRACALLDTKLNSIGIEINSQEDTPEGERARELRAIINQFIDGEGKSIPEVLTLIQDELKKLNSEEKEGDI